MATVEEIKIKGRAYRVFDAVNSIWKRISYWVAASDVEFEDGENLENKLPEMQSDLTDSISQVSNELDQAKTELNSTINTKINTVNSTMNSNYVKKTQLSFVLSGNDLYITKNY